MTIYWFTWLLILTAGCTITAVVFEDIAAPKWAVTLFGLLAAVGFVWIIVVTFSNGLILT